MMVMPGAASKTVDLILYDAGTDNGTTYRPLNGDDDTNPPDLIQSMADVAFSNPFQTATIVGQFTFTLETILPVELARFQGFTDQEDVILKWETLSEQDHDGFSIEHWSVSSPQWQALDFIPGRGDSSTPQVYIHRIPDLPGGIHRFRLAWAEPDGTKMYSSVVEVYLEIPGLLQLGPVYPNPFSTFGTFTLSTRTTQPLQVHLFDLFGRQLSTVFEGVLSAGQVKTIYIMAETFPTGIYFYRAEGQNISVTRSLVISR